MYFVDSVDGLGSRKNNLNISRRSYQAPAFSVSVTKLGGAIQQWNKIRSSREATPFISPARECWGGEQWKNPSTLQVAYTAIPEVPKTHQP